MAIIEGEAAEGIQSAPIVDPGRSAGSPLARFARAGCGHGASLASAPDRSPMCGETPWDLEPWRPFQEQLDSLDRLELR